MVSVDELAEDVSVVEIHLIVDGVIDGIVVVAIELHIPSILKLR